MSFRSPVAVSSIALLAAAALLPSQGFARDARRAGGDVIYQMAPMASEPAADEDDIIVELPPLRPVKRAQKAPPKSAQQPAAPQPVVPVAAKPEPAPAPLVAARPASAAAPVEPASPAVAVAPAQQPPAPLVATPPVEAQPLAQAPVDLPAAQLRQTPAETPVAEAAPAPVEATPIPVQQPVAQAPAEPTPAVVQAAQPVEPARVGPPTMILNSPRKSLAGVPAPGPLDQTSIDMQGGSSAPTLVPGLASVAAPRDAAAAPETAAPALPEAPAAAPEASGAAQGDADARLAQILAEGVAGPTEVRLADRATMWLPAGRVFLPVEAARKLAAEVGMDWRPGVQGIVAPTGGKLEWLAPVETIDDGHIAVEGAAPFAADKILAAFQASLPEINAAREKSGQPAVAIDSWLAEPALTDKRRLSACVNIALLDQTDRFFNCEAWAFGRSGAIKVGLADGGERAARLKDEAAALADTIVFDRDKTYEAFDPAADKLAPYAAADLLTRDVTARSAKAAPAPAPVEQEPPAAGGFMTNVLLFALAGGAALLLYLRRKARRDAGAEAEAAPEPVAQKAAAAEQTAAPAASSSLFARLLPTLYARFAKQPFEAASAPAAVLPIVETPQEKPQSALAGLRGRLGGVRGAAKDSPSATAPAANDTEEPASALKRLAAKMRKPKEEPVAAAPVNVSRAIRGGARVAAAAAVAEKLPEALVVEEAPEDAETELGLLEPGDAGVTLMEPAQEAPAPQPAAQPAQGYDMFDDDDFGLVEPGQGAASPAPDRRLSDG